MVLNNYQSNALFSKAQKLAGKNRLDEAVTLYDQALQLNPKSSGAFLHRALALAENESYDLALESVRQAIRFKPKNPVYPMFLGMIQYDRQDFEAAVQAFDTALAIDSHYEIARVFKDLIDFRTGNMEEAFIRFKGNYNWGLDFQSRLLTVCEAYLNHHREIAKSYFQTDLSMANTTAAKDNPLKRFFVEMKFGFLKLGSQIVDLDMAKRDVKETYLRGNRFLAFNEFDEALKEYQKIITDGDHRLSGKAMQQIVEVFLAKCDFPNALKYIELSEDFQSTLEFLAQLPERSESRPKYPSLHSELVLVMGIIHYEMGNFAKSAAILNLAGELDPKNYLIDYYLGLDALESSQLQTSRNRLKKALGAVNEGLLAKRVNEAMRVVHLKKETN